MVPADVAAVDSVVSWALAEKIDPRSKKQVNTKIVSDRKKNFIAPFYEKSKNLPSENLQEVHLQTLFRLGYNITKQLRLSFFVKRKAV
jgi:hypothetical protein